MPIKNLILLILFGLTLNLSSQSQNLIFKLEGHVYSYSVNKIEPLPLGDVLVKLMVEDQTIAETYTDSSGFYVFEFDSNGNKLQMLENSFIVEVNSNNKPDSEGIHYLPSKGLLVTKEIKESVVFTRDFYLVEQCSLGDPKFPLFRFTDGISFRELEDYSIEDSLKYSIQILKENPSITVQIDCFSKSSQIKSFREKANIARNREEFLIEQFVINGINPARLSGTGNCHGRPVITDEEMANAKAGIVKPMEHDKCVIQIISFDFTPED